MPCSLWKKGRIARVAVLAAMVLGSIPALSPSRVQAQDVPAAVVAKVKDLNKKAIEAYENLDLDEARKFLLQALEVCATEGLSRHPLKAVTHANLGAVLIGGLKQRDLGVRQFKRAIEVDPGVRVSRRLSNPEIQAAFDDVVKGGVEAVKPEPAPAPANVDSKPEPAVADDGAPPKAITGIFHESVSEGKPNTPITIKAAVEVGLAFDRVILAYRPDGADDFLARDMEKDSQGWFVARIPEPATGGSVVAYYIEARSRKGVAIAANGSSGEPHLVTLAAPEAPVAGATEPVPARPARRHPEDEPTVTKGPEDADPDVSTTKAGGIMIGLGLGAGYGYASGTPELNPIGAAPDRSPIAFSGMAAAGLLHFSPEVGYYYSQRLLLSIQGRIQIVTGATSAKSGCSPAPVCEPAKGALAAMAKATWFFSTAAFRPYVAFAAGGGDIRHLVDISARRKDCGDDMKTGCVDTVLGGIILVGPAAGFFYDVSDKLTLTLGVNGLGGFPKTTFNVDVNVGIAVGF